MISKAIILAAGMGRRIRKFNSNNPKCLIKIPHENISIIEKQITILQNYKIKDILVITGYKSEILKKKISNYKGVRFGYYPYYKKTNNLNTLLHFKHELNSSLVCLFADVIFDKKIISRLISQKNNILAAIDTGNILEGTMKIRIKENKIIEIGSHIPIKFAQGNFIGICKFSKKGSIMLKKNLIELKHRVKDYYTIAIQKMIDNKKSIFFLDCKNFKWKEIDTIKDYNLLKKIRFTS